MMILPGALGCIFSHWSDRFIHVYERWKCPNFEHMEIDESALYLIAAPSTPEAVACPAVRARKPVVVALQASSLR